MADSTRARVVCLVTVDKLPVKQAAAQNKLNPSTVYRWLADINSTFINKDR
jgi:transposase-like protein